MKNRRNTKRKLTPFERETERRRRAMLRDLAGRQAHVPSSFLRVLPRHARVLLLARPKAKEVRV